MQPPAASDEAPEPCAGRRERTMMPSVPITLRRGCVAALLITLALSSRSAMAHPAPFSYLDIRLSPSAITGALVVHDFDVAHELGIADPATLGDPSVVAKYAAALAALARARIVLEADGRVLPWEVVETRPLADRASVELKWRVQGGVHSAGRLMVHAALFPYDPNHQTFVNIYENDRLVRQDILNRTRDRLAFYTGTRQGAIAVFKTFTASGIHHIAIGPDHILFLIGLILLGGSVRRLLLIISAFTLGHSITLSLAALGIVTPPAHVIEPAIALSIVYVGADNLLVGSSGRDARAWVALFFGLVHGFGFASVLYETGLPPGAVGLSLFSFNLGVEIGQAFIVFVVASVLGAIRTRHPALMRRIVLAGSLVVIAAGTYWFVQRVG
jgi:hydrogenase/urease accessory protein HupE